MTSLSPPLSRALALTVLFVAIAGTWSLAVQPVLDVIFAGEQELTSAATLLARYRAVAEMRAATQAQLDTLRRDPMAGRLVLEGNNAQVAAAELQNRLKRLIESNGAVMKSAQVLPTRDEGNFRRTTLRITMEADTEGIQKIFHSLETSSPLLFIDNVEVRSRQLNSLRQQQPTKRMADLIVGFDVYGYLRVAAQ
jgi:general secretion pathway protein M